LTVTLAAWQLVQKMVPELTVVLLAPITPSMLATKVVLSTVLALTLPGWPPLAVP